ncbi:hypothetical protein BGZ52_005628 [Haplosporangium bisporale]|nr:hypothetical protein BGZ52_005628 [Haplosporangium bisporale]KAF9216062.1 hypothetical protein BGZ59_011155 [Podila verticillata]
MNYIAPALLSSSPYFTDQGMPMMHTYHLPPIFTSQGYHPSILMDLSPHKCSSAQVNCAPVVQETATHDEDQPDIVQVWLCSSPRNQMQEIPTSRPDLPCQQDDSNLCSRSSTVALSSLGGNSAEWASCASSPMSRTVPEMPDTVMSIHPQDVDSVVPVEGSSEELKDSPLTYILRPYPMRPRIEFRDRSRCIFLDTSARTKQWAKRRVTQLLYNSSIQETRSWFKNTVEPSALEQCRNYYLMQHMNDEVVPVEKPTPLCPICYTTETVMKSIVPCRHSICWKCELDLNEVGNISCPMCRRLRLVSEHHEPLDMFCNTIGLQSRDYVHFLQLSGQVGRRNMNMVARFGEDDDPEYFEHALTDRYRWEPSASLMETLCTFQSSPRHRDHPLLQYFQLNAVKDLCYTSAANQDLLEYKDGVLLEPPTSGLQLPPHRLYIALTHLCIDMMTLPFPSEFQSNPQYQREFLMLQLVAMFLIPTNEYSPRDRERIADIEAWRQQGRMIIHRVQKMVQTKARMAMLQDVMADDLEYEEEQELRRQIAPPGYVSSVPAERDVLYLGPSRWIWIAQALSTMLEWIEIARMNPSLPRRSSAGSRDGGQTAQAKRRVSVGKDEGPSRKRIRLDCEWPARVNGDG